MVSVEYEGVSEAYLCATTVIGDVGWWRGRMNMQL